MRLQHLVDARLLGLFGFSISSIVNGVLSALTKWIESGARAVAGSFGHVLTSSTAVTFGSGFVAEFQLLRGFGEVLVALFLCVVVIQSILQQNAQLLFRTVGLRLPAALLLSGIGVEIVTMLLRATDVVSAALLNTSARSVPAVIGEVTAVFAGTALSSPVIAGFEALFFALVLAVVAFVCWLELAVRAAAISIATLFIPLALAGVVWPATERWIRRLGETLFALIISKVVIAGVFALAVSSMGTPTGVNSIVEAIALFVLCAWAPFSVLRLVPMVEAGAISHLESLGHRSSQSLRHLAQAAGPFVGDYLSPAPPDGVEQVDAIPYADVDPSVRVEVDPEDEEAFNVIKPWVVVRDPQPERSGSAQPGRPPSIRRVGLDAEGDDGR